MSSNLPLNQIKSHVIQSQPVSFFWPEDSKYSEKLEHLVRNLLTPNPDLRPTAKDMKELLTNWDKIPKIELNKLACSIKNDYMARKKPQFGIPNHDFKDNQQKKNGQSDGFDLSGLDKWKNAPPIKPFQNPIKDKVNPGKSVKSNFMDFNFDNKGPNQNQNPFAMPPQNQFVGQPRERNLSPNNFQSQGQDINQIQPQMTRYSPNHFINQGMNQNHQQVPNLNQVNYQNPNTNQVQYQGYSLSPNHTQNQNQAQFANAQQYQNQVPTQFDLNQNQINEQSQPVSFAQNNGFGGDSNQKQANPNLNLSPFDAFPVNDNHFWNANPDPFSSNNQNNQNSQNQHQPSTDFDAFFGETAKTENTNHGQNKVQEFDPFAQV